jgi:hypothetical protein
MIVVAHRYSIGGGFGCIHGICHRKPNSGCLQTDEQLCQTVGIITIGGAAHFQYSL